MAKRRTSSVFNTNKRIRLGIWGLGRGMSFYQACEALHFDVVAGCDYNAYMRKNFLDANPGAFATDDADEFLAQDMDAVLLATFCPAHADDAIRCLESGKHVLSEVTAFHTMAEGVALVEAVERTGRVYNLAENYPFTAPHAYLARRWGEGLFGDLQYAEGEYVHDVRSLAFTYVDGVPVNPGYRLHNWRSWLNFHYYCTHSLGPVMHITGTRPVRVSALPAPVGLPGLIPSKEMGMAGVTPSLIAMDNGAVVRNLMGNTTNDVHQFRYWGTKGSAEIGHGGLLLRLGGHGYSPQLSVDADWGDLTPLAEKMGHGGGDFFVLYYFARQLLFGEPAPFDIYNAADVTIPGILAYRSAQENGVPYDVPDFRKKADRDAYRRDDKAQARYDVDGMFPKRADKSKTKHFDRIVSDLLYHAGTVRAFMDWSAVFDDAHDKAAVVRTADKLIESYPDIRSCMRKARRLAVLYPRSDGARVLKDILTLGAEKTVLGRGFLDDVKKQRTRMKRRLRK